MRQNPPNARFWEWIHSSPVKLTLRPGQHLTHVTSAAHDEGWTSEASTWTHVTSAVRSSLNTDNRDCDGRLSTHAVHYSLLDDLDQGPEDFDQILDTHDEPIRYPHWNVDDIGQRDYSAEAMNY